MTVDTATSEPEARIAEESRRMNDLHAELRDAHGDPVAELPIMTVYADQYGDELNVLADDLGMDMGTVSEWMHEQARGVDYEFNDCWPVVVLHD